MKYLIISIALLFSGLVNAAEFKGINFDDTVTIGKKTLVLNGMAYRIVPKFGLPIKVYVGAFYLEKKESDPEKIMTDKSIKHVVMKFVRTVEKEQMEDGWKEALYRNCRKDCEESKILMKDFNKLMAQMRDKSTMTISFYPDYVDVNVDGREKKSGQIKSAAFVENLLACFFGPKVVDEGLKTGLLGLSK